MSSSTLGSAGGVQAPFYPTLLQNGLPRRPGPEGAGKPAAARVEEALAPQTIGRALAEPKASALASVPGSQPAAGGASGAAPCPNRSALEPPVASQRAPVPAAGLAADDAASARRQHDEEALWTAAMAALEERGRQEKVRAFLREHGFEGVNTASGWFRPRFPLHQAVELGDARMVDLLLRSKARRRVCDCKGLTPQELAREKCGDFGPQDEVLQVFKQHHAKRAAEKRKRAAETRQRDAALLHPAPRVSSLALPYLPECLERASAGAPCLLEEPEARDALVQCLSAASEVAALQAALEAEGASRRAAEAEVEALRARLQAAGLAEGI